MSDPATIALQGDSQPLPATKSWSKPRSSNKPPRTKALVVAKRIQGDSKRKIARDLKLSRVTVTSILDESDMDQQFETGRFLTAGLIPSAIGVIEHRLSQNSENAAIKVLEATIWPLNKQVGKPNDAHLTLAIQNLMGNVQVNAVAPQAKDTAQISGPEPQKPELQQATLDCSASSDK